MDPRAIPPSRGITEPVGHRLLGELRRAVLDHSTSERRRVFPPAVNVGVPAADPGRLVLGGQRLDHALRVDVLEAMVRRAGRRQPPGTPLLVWVTRSGSRETHDVDLAWLAATRTASAELGQDLVMVVVTRRGWHDPATGVHREWVRLRPSRAPGPAPGR